MLNSYYPYKELKCKLHYNIFFYKLALKCSLTFIASHLFLAKGLNILLKLTIKLVCGVTVTQ